MVQKPHKALCKVSPEKFQIKTFGEGAQNIVLKHPDTYCAHSVIRVTTTTQHSGTDMGPQINK